MPAPRLALLALAPLLAGGCVAKTALDVVTLPVKVVSKGVDLATTSQSEADEKRGREIRRREERVGELQRDYARLAEDCEDGSDRACREAIAVRREIDALLPGLPREPERR